MERALSGSAPSSGALRHLLPQGGKEGRRNDVAFGPFNAPRACPIRLSGHPLTDGCVISYIAAIALSGRECYHCACMAAIKRVDAWGRAGASRKPEDCNPMKFRPLHDRVVVKRLEGEEKSKGGIIIPDTAKEKPQEGEIIAVGPGGRDESGKLTPLDVRAGDKVLFGKWSGTEVKINGQDLLIMKESDIMGIVG